MLVRPSNAAVRMGSDEIAVLLARADPMLYRTKSESRGLPPWRGCRLRWKGPQRGP